MFINLTFYYLLPTLPSKRLIIFSFPAPTIIWKIYILLHTLNTQIHLKIFQQSLTFISIFSLPHRVSSVVCPPKHTCTLPWITTQFLSFILELSYIFVYVNHLLILSLLIFQAHNYFDLTIMLSQFGLNFVSCIILIFLMLIWLWAEVQPL